MVEKGLAKLARSVAVSYMHGREVMGGESVAVYWRSWA